VRASRAVKLKHLYMVLGTLGVVLPFTQFMPWVIDSALDLPLLVAGTESSRLAALSWLDVGVAAITLPNFVLSHGRRNRVPGLWLPTVGAVTVGVSLGPPPYLLTREMRHEAVA
jgi:hypothetical protein